MFWFSFFKSSTVSLELKFNFFTKINETKGKDKITTIEIIIHIFLQSVKVNKNIVNTGKINSADDKPNQMVLNAFPLDFVKYLETVVVAVCDIIPCPENLIKNIAKNKKATEEIFEKKKHENDKRIVTKEANLKIFISSIFFPSQIRITLLNKVADA